MQQYLLLSTVAALLFIGAACPSKGASACLPAIDTRTFASSEA
jgi:hypothetical protein